MVLYISLNRSDLARWTLEFPLLCRRPPRPWRLIYGEPSRDMRAAKSGVRRVVVIGMNAPHPNPLPGGERGLGQWMLRRRREAMSTRALAVTMKPPKSTANRASTAAARAPARSPPSGRRFQQSE